MVSGQCAAAALRAIKAHNHFFRATGDSISEGVLTLGGSQSFDTDHNDNSVCYSWALGPLLGANMGIVGFGATGLSRAGSGGVPPLGVSWNQLWDGVPRAFEPKVCVLRWTLG